MSRLYDFDHPHRTPPAELRRLLGGKGAELAEMTSVGLPVPPGFTITTEACRSFLAGGAWPADLDREIDDAVHRIEQRVGCIFGDPSRPLLLALRSGAVAAPTILDLGLTDQVVEGLARTTDVHVAFDSYRRLIESYARAVLGVDGAAISEVGARFGVEGGADPAGHASPIAMRALCQAYLDLIRRETGSSFPQDPRVQLRGAIQAVFRCSAADRITASRRGDGASDHPGTAANVQAMVFGNRGPVAGTGVAFSRDPSTGAAVPVGKVFVGARGGDVVASNRPALELSEMAARWPDVHDELLRLLRRLEHHHRDMCETTFTVEGGRLWMLGSRVGERSGAAALRIALDLSGEPSIGLTREEAVLRVRPEHLEQVLHPQIAGRGRPAVGRGLAASPGAAVGRAYFTADDACAAVDRGEHVILVRTETSPDDIHGFQISDGILTARGGLVSHAAVVARGWGIPAVVGLDALLIDAGWCSIGDATIREGDLISLDGSTGDVFVGEIDVSSADVPPEFDTILRWADDIRSTRLEVRANADTGEDARRARELGARGIGLCRTEHMFLATDRLPIVQKMILAADPDAEADALEDLRSAQRADFVEILRAMDGLPVTVRLLDPPLHEFLPPPHAFDVKAATAGLDEVETALRAAADTWHEANPMLGTRGVRLGILKPRLYPMQVRALLDAVADRVAAGGRPIVEIMIPLTVAHTEVALVRSWIEDVINEASSIGDAQIQIGTMIETPRAALTAAELAAESDFLSFGTNDLTQTTFAFSRDDVETRMLPLYLELGILGSNPFETLDTDGVGQLIRLAVERGRAASSALKVGVCGEHGGDPRSIEFMVSVGADYVSCSPFRVPIARLAGAHAVLAAAGRQPEHSACADPRTRRREINAAEERGR